MHNDFFKKHVPIPCMPNLLQSNLLHSGKTGLRLVRGGLYDKQFFRIAVDSLLKAGNSEKVSCIPKGSSEKWDSVDIFAMLDLEDLESCFAQVYFEIIAANTFDELQHVLMTNQFYDAEEFLSPDAIKS